MISTMAVMFGAIVILSGITIALKRKQTINTLSIRELERKERERTLRQLQSAWQQSHSNKIPVKIPGKEWTEKEKKLFADTWKKLNEKIPT